MEPVPGTPIAAVALLVLATSRIEAPAAAASASPPPAGSAATPSAQPPRGPFEAGAEAVSSGPLAALADALARLGARTPVRARVEHRLATRTGDDASGQRPEGVVRALATVGPGGLQISWSPEVLAQADLEEQRRSADPEAPTPARDALADLRPLALARALDAGPELLRLIRRAELLEVHEEEREGAPSRLLVLRVTPALSARERKYVSEVEATARIWLGADGLPVAAEQHVKATGRVLLVIGFESERRESFRFARSGDRLVAVRHEQDQRSEGAGEKGARRAVTTLELLP